MSAQVAPDPVVIAQDEQVEIHVQAVTQSGQRQVDVRLWRLSPSGFQPSHSALMLDARNLDALIKGIREMLASTGGGREVARNVWDHAEGRRLRAEIEPYGARYIARLGFWQRVRGSWRPADDTVVIAAERLPDLRETLLTFRPWLTQPRREPQWVPITAQPDILDRWPAPGADWVTVETERVAFHPRGLRITAAVEMGEHGPRAVLQQWRRQDSLWLPEAARVSLGITEIEETLSALVRLGGGEREVTIVAGDDRVRLSAGQGNTLTVARITPGGEEVALQFPWAELPRFGRALAHSWVLLVGQLSDEERSELQILHEIETLPEPAEAGEVLELEPEPEPELEPEPEPDPIQPVPLGTLQLGNHAVTLELIPAEPPRYALRWAEEMMELSSVGLPDFLAELRTLYYDALRGRRRTVSMGQPVELSAAAQSRGLDMVVVMQPVEGSPLELPAREVPSFLDALETIITRG